MIAYNTINIYLYLNKSDSLCSKYEHKKGKAPFRAREMNINVFSTINYLRTLDHNTHLALEYSSHETESNETEKTHE